MSDSRGPSYDIRKGYTPNDYIPSSQPQQRGPQSDYYANRAPPYESLYRRSFVEPVSSRSSSAEDYQRRHSVTRYNDRNGDRGGDRGYDRNYARNGDRDYDRNGDRDYDRGSGRSGASRRSDYNSQEYSDSDYQEGGGSKRQVARQKMPWKGEENKQKLRGEGEEVDGNFGGNFGKEQKDIAATLIGAVAGGFLAHEASSGRRAATLGGVLLGAVSGNAIEHRHLKHVQGRERNEQRWEEKRKNGEEPYDSD